jgi:hypothetical protein
VFEHVIGKCLAVGAVLKDDMAESGLNPPLFTGAGQPDAVLPCSTQPGRYGSLAQWFTRFLDSHGEISPSRPGAHL